MSLLPSFGRASLTTLMVQPDIKNMQYQLTGFLEADAAKFCKELWVLLLSAQASPQGVPKKLLEAKKAELIQEKVRESVCGYGRGVCSGRSPAVLYAHC